MALLHICRPFFLFIFLAFVILSGCSDDHKKAPEVETDLLSQRAAFFIHPVTGARKQGDTIRLETELSDSSQVFDSIVVRMDDEKIETWKEGVKTVLWPSAGKKMGAHIFKVEGYRGSESASTASLTFFIRSDEVPAEYRYEIVKTLPHNPGSFTQGLEWNGDHLYEGTGLNGKSAVMKINPETGEAETTKNLGTEFFGEGITIVNNKLYQITWQNRRGFIYSLPDLKPEKEFSYPTDGWGLTHFSGKLAMTSGSNTVYFLDPEKFQSLGKTEVWDNKNPVEELNELEFVNGRIFANKYQTDTLVEFDPETGKVLGYANLKNLLPDADRIGNEDVLNGIAYHPKEKLFYVTGKNWPKMFAIRLIRKSGI
jgi:glutamine cyclotransferase